MRIVIAASVIAAVVTSADAQNSNYSGTYFCSENLMAALSFDEEARQWRENQLGGSRDFVVTVIPPGPEDSTQSLAISPLEQPTNPCLSVFAPDYEEAQERAGSFLCSELETWFYRFDFEALRYVSTYLHGFVTGDDPEDSPYISAGRCTKIDDALDRLD